MDILEQCTYTSQLQNLRLQSFLKFFPVLKYDIVQIDLKSIKDAASKICGKSSTSASYAATATLSKQQLDKVFKDDLSYIAHAILPLYNCSSKASNHTALSYNGEIEFYINKAEIFANCHNYERLDVVVHGAYNINNLHFFVKKIRQWLLCEDVTLMNKTQQSKLDAIIMKHYFHQYEDSLNENTNLNQLSDFGLALQHWIESL